MIRKLTLGAGFAAGYVLGAKAGKQRYSQIEAQVRKLLGQPAVQDFTSSVSSTAGAAADKAKATVNEKVEAVSDKVSSSSPSTPPVSSTPPPVPPLHAAPITGAPPLSPVTQDEIIVVDLGGPGTAPSGPVTGAYPSSSAPDVL